MRASRVRVPWGVGTTNNSTSNFFLGSYRWTPTEHNVIQKKRKFVFWRESVFWRILEKENICSQWIWILPLSYSLRVIDDGGEALLLLLLPIVEEPSLSLYSSLLLDDFLDNRKWNLIVTHSWYFLFNFLFTDVAIIRARKACDTQLLEQAEAWLIIFCLLPVCDRGKDTHRVGLQQEEGKYARWRTILTSSSSIHGIVG